MPVTGFTASPPFALNWGIASYPWSSIHRVSFHRHIVPWIWLMDAYPIEG